MSTFTDPPMDIFLAVLTKLTPKEILRCRAVCKKWRDTIHRRQFINFHLQRSIIAANQNLSDVIRYLVIERPNIYPMRRRQVNINANHFRQIKAIFIKNISLTVFPPNQRWDSKAAGGKFRLLGHCNGLVAMGSLTGDTILANPFTRKWIQIPDPPVTKSLSILMGFGYDSVNRDYKLLRAVKCESETNSFFVEIVIYSLKAKSWKRSGYIDDRRMESVECWVCVPNGNSLFWVVKVTGKCDCREQGDSKVIMGLDLSTEKGLEIPVPCGVFGHEDSGLELANFEEFGIGVVFAKNESNLKKFQGWDVRGDGTRLFSVEAFPSFRPLSPVGLDWAVLYKNGTDCILFQPEMMILKVLSDSPSSSDQEYIEYVFCFQSLVGVDDTDWKDSQIQEVVNNS